MTVAGQTTRAIDSTRGPRGALTANVGAPSPPPVPVSAFLETIYRSQTIYCFVLINITMIKYVVGYRLENGNRV